jgi:CheY-like chemotaxis protein
MNPCGISTLTIPICTTATRIADAVPTGAEAGAIAVDRPFRLARRLEPPFTSPLLEHAFGLPVRPQELETNLTDHLKLFADQRILIVEDEFLFAEEARRSLERYGAEVVGPVSSVAEGIDLVESSNIDAAILDVRLDGEVVFPLADLLDQRAIPFVFATGVDPSAIPARYSGYVICEKPMHLDVIAKALFAPTSSDH